MNKKTNCINVPKKASVSPRNATSYRDLINFSPGKSCRENGIYDDLSSNASSLGILEMDRLKDFTEEPSDVRSKKSLSPKPNKWEMQLSPRNKSPNRWGFPEEIKLISKQKSPKQPNKLVFPEEMQLYSRQKSPKSNKYVFPDELLGKGKSADAAKWNNWESRTAEKYPSINLSDLIEDNTIDARSAVSTPSRYRFEPNEITGRSTECLERKSSKMYSPSVEEILANSFSADVRGMGAALENMKVRESLSERNSLPRTADMSMASSGQTNLKKVDNWFCSSEFSKEGDANFNEEFLSASKMSTRLMNDEQDYLNEYAVIPIIKSKQPPPHNTNDSEITVDGENRPTFNVSEFSRYKFENENVSMISSIDNVSDFSIGQFFNNRSEPIRQMIPNRSPNKRYKPIALATMADISAVSDENPVVAKKPYENKNLLSLSDIASRLDKCDRDESPRSLATKLFVNKPSKLIEQNEPANKDLPGIAYITKPLPLNNNQNSNVEILKYEEYFGSVPEIIEKSDAIRPTSKALQHLQKKTTELTPNRTHIRSVKPPPFQYARENKENILSDTLSFSDTLLDMSDLKSPKLAPKIVITEATLLQNIESPTALENDECCNSEEETPKMSPQITPTRKRQRDSLLQAAQSASPQTKSLTSVAEKLTSVIKETKNKNVFVFSSPHKVQSPDRPKLLAQSPIKETPRSKSPKHSPNYTQTSSAFSSPRYCSSKANFAANDPTYKNNQYASTDQGHCVQHASSCQSTRPASPTLLTQCNSQCSSTSDLSGSNRDDVSALKSSHGELSWPSTKLRKSVKKSFTVKNTSHRKLTLKIEIIGPGFQIFGNDQTSTSLSLQAHECRTICLSFCPTVMGPATGKICFHSAKESQYKTVRVVHLYGYGGNTLLQIQNVEKGPLGCSFLKMGEATDLAKMLLHRSFIVYNRGPLRGIVVVRIKTKSNEDFTNIELNPDKFIIEADSCVLINVTYRPRRSDLKKLLKKPGDVITIAMLEIITGDDANRQRLRSLIARADADYSSLDCLLNDFPNDRKSFDGFEEKVSNISDLFGCLKSEELALTLNRTTLNETIESESEQFISEMDETVLFRTLVPDNSPQQAENIVPPQQSSAALAVVQQQSSRYQRADTWQVYPRHLVMNPFDRSNIQTITIKTNFSKSQTFELDSNCPHIFQISPAAGCIDAGNSEIEITIKIRKVVLPSFPLMLVVYIDNDKMDIAVEVDPAGVPTALR